MEEESDKINGGNSDIPFDPLQSLKSQTEMRRNIEGEQQRKDGYASSKAGETDGAANVMFGGG